MTDVLAWILGTSRLQNLLRAGIGSFALGLVLLTAQAQPNLPIDFTIQATVATESSPPKIVLRWPQGRFVSTYAISRKQPVETNWQTIASLPPDATRYEDKDVAIGRPYEYQLTKSTSRGFTGYGYVFTGIDLPMIENRGKILLLADETHAGALDPELNRLERDWIGDGWGVVRRTVSRNESVANVKSLIQAEYEREPATLKAVLLFGHIPVPYSGNIHPDGHDNHLGAWPADVYYGDTDGIWTDSTVNSAVAEKEINWNIPGDGKFDQNQPPSSVELQVGRVDFWQMTAFSNKTPSRSEQDLLRQYLQKNHDFRHGRLPIARRGLIADLFPDKGDDPVGGSAWRNFSSFFGAEGIREVGWGEYLPTATAESFLWSFGAGGGSSYTVSAGIAGSDDFALQEPRVVFAMFLGSHYGDWNNESNFLRASLGSGQILAAAYAGFPHWFFQHMALGETIGFSTRFTQNNRPDGYYPPYNEGAGEVHIALFGDPTLRMHPVVPPSELKLSETASGVNLAWRHSPDTNVLGYHVYRAATPSGPITRINGDPIVLAAEFTDSPGPGPGTHTYLVRAVKLETSASGSYRNPSQGVFETLTITNGTPETPLALRINDSVQQTGLYRIQLSGKTAQSIVLEVSADLKLWTGLSTNVITPEGLEIQDPPSSRILHRFYRARALDP